MSHRVNRVRPLEDDQVDRPEVYARQRVQPTGTNRPRAWIDNETRARYGVLKGERTDLGGYSGGVTPVPIPNTAVKPASADGTWGESPWESRTPPVSLERAPRKGGSFFVLSTIR